MRHSSLFDGIEDATLLLPGLTIGRLLNTALAFFFLRLLLAVVAHRQMLYPRYGRTHRLAGMALLFYLVAGLVDAIMERVDRNTCLVMIDHVSSPTAMLFPVKRIIDRCHELDVPVMVPRVTIEYLDGADRVSEAVKSACGFAPVL